MSKAKRKPLQIVIEDGEPSAVILDIEEYRVLLERLQDTEDLKLLEDMRKHPLKFKKLDVFLAKHPCLSF